MPDFTVYDVETGRVLNSGRTGSLKQIAIQSKANTEIVLGEQLDAETHYVVEHEAVPRPRFTPLEQRTIRADGVHKTTISNLPAGTILRFEGENHPIDDGLFEFLTAVPGTYRFALRGPWPHREQTVTVIANAP